SVQNENVHYASKQDVYIVLNDDSGLYTITVEAPDGTLLGQSASPVSITTFDGTAATVYNLWNLVVKASDSSSQGYDTTTNPGGEYKVSVDNGLSGRDKVAHSDNFKVEIDPCIANPAACEVLTPGTISGTKWEDLDGSAATTDDRPNGIGGITIFVDVNGNT